MVAMYALTQTPLGRIANAVRDNPERAEFIGYNTQRVRWLMLILSSFFAGIAGGLTAINFEIVSARERQRRALGGRAAGGVHRRGELLLRSDPRRRSSSPSSPWRCPSTRRPGSSTSACSSSLLVMFAPGGLSSLLLMNLRVMKFGKFGRLRDPYVGVLPDGAGDGARRRRC